jgi:hypothetical protein
VKEGDHLENLGKDEGVILKYIMKKYGVRMWLGYTYSG